MPGFSQYFPLVNLNTFGISVNAQKFCKVDSVKQLVDAIKSVPTGTPLLVLGGGSNILFTKDFEGVVIQPAIQGIEEIFSDNESVLLSVGAGVEWDYLVERTVEMGLGGLENLSLIPGTVGASPIQNIGAYGAEAKDCIDRVITLDINSTHMNEFTNGECMFGYRDSIFKQDLKGKVVVTNVWFKLSKKPVLRTHYGNLEEELDRLGSKSLKSVRQAVINIRSSKLPDPKLLGNAGSFFKNPVVSIEKVKGIQEIYGNVPIYPVSDNFVKLPAGWLIEKAGWKGKRIGNVGVHQHQALVLVNYGGAKGSEVLELAKQIQDSVKERFSVDLETEVNII